MRRTFSRLVILGEAFAVFIGINVLITGQPASNLSRQAASQHLVGVVDDWSFHHLVFSNPGTYEQAAKDPAAYAKWLTIRNDTRFILQQMKRHAEATGGFSREMRTRGEEAVSPSGMVEPEDLAIGALRQLPGEARARLKPKPKPNPKPRSNGDWSEPLLTGTVQPNAYPAKWGPGGVGGGNNLTSASCSDYVVYPTGTAGASSTPGPPVTPGAASIVAYNNLYFGCGGSGAVPSVRWAYNTDGGTISTSPIISLDGSQVAFIQVNSYGTELALLKWGPFPGGTVTSPDSPEYEAPSGYRDYCNDQPCWTALAFNNLNNDTYSAPFYEYDSNDALYVGDDSGYLHKFTGVFYGNPAEVVPTTLMPTIPWPVHLSTTNKLTSPVYDPVSGNVFVGHTGGYFYAVGTGNAGTIDANVTTSAKLGDVIIDGPLVDPSAGMVYAFVTTNNDTTPPSNAVFQFYTTTSTTCTAGTFCTGSSGNNTTYGIEVGAGGAGYYLYAGDFDNVYYSSTAGTAGNLWVMGNTGTAGGNLYRIPISAAGAMESPKAMITGLTDTTAGQYPWPSPITEFCNQTIASTPCGASGGVTTDGIDYIFFSVDKLATAEGTCTTSSTAGCVLAYIITNPTATLTTPSGAYGVTTVGTPGCWATGGIVIDNSDATMTGASQVYFINLSGNYAGDPTTGNATSSACNTTTGTTGNTVYAVQASQAALE